MQFSVGYERFGPLLSKVIRFSTFFSIFSSPPQVISALLLDLMPTTSQFMFPCCSVLLTCHLHFEALSLVLNLPKTKLFILSASPTHSSTIFSLLPSTQFSSLKTLQSFLKLVVTYCCLPMHLQPSNKYYCLLTSPLFSISPAVTTDYYLVILPALLLLPPQHSIFHTFSIE